MGKSDLVVKSNRLNMAIQNLTLLELRIIQLAIVDARETGKGLSTDTPLRIDAMRYAEVFNTTRQNAYQRMKEAEETLFNRRFSFISKENKLIKSRWLSQVLYLDSDGAIEIIFTPAVVQGITRLDGAEDFFTQYLLTQTANLNSLYSVRLYELLAQWKHATKTPTFDLNMFRGQLGIHSDEYKRMYDFKKYVLNSAIEEINSKTDLNVSYKQEKRGRAITGFKFTVKTKDKVKDKKNNDRDAYTIDMINDSTDSEAKHHLLWQVNGLTDKQINKIAIFSEEFCQANISLMSPSFKGSWNDLFESWRPSLKNPKQVNKFKKVQELLERQK